MVSDVKRALIIGSNGTLGSALTKRLKDDFYVHCINRDNTDYSETSLNNLANELKTKGRLHRIICCIGVLHNDSLSPEKSLKQLNEKTLSEYFYINTILPALSIKAFSPLLCKDSDTQFAVLSAMVGSIEDNKLGGWYGYRSSKAALNMLIKTASIEFTRTHKKCSIAAIHPGTTRGNLSRPFTAKIDPNKYYTPEQSAMRILRVIDNLTPKTSGSFLNWDGTEIPW